MSLDYSPPSSPDRELLSRLDEDDVSPAVKRLHGLLQKILRIAVTDGRIFIGTFAGTDQLLNLLLINTEEYRVGPNENPDGRYVGQVLVPWKLVVKVEARMVG